MGWTLAFRLLVLLACGPADPDARLGASSAEGTEALGKRVDADPPARVALAAARVRDYGGAALRAREGGGIVRR